jgi:hypothetical protein
MTANTYTAYKTSFGEYTMNPIEARHLRTENGNVGKQIQVLKDENKGVNAPHSKGYYYKRIKDLEELQAGINGALQSNKVPPMEMADEASGLQYVVGSLTDDFLKPLARRTEQFNKCTSENGMAYAVRHYGEEVTQAAYMSGIGNRVLGNAGKDGATTVETLASAVEGMTAYVREQLLSSRDMNPNSSNPFSNAATISENEARVEAYRALQLATMMINHVRECTEVGKWLTEQDNKPFQG